MAVSTPTGSRVTKRQLRKALTAYRSGIMTKTAIERSLGVSSARGKWITRAWYAQLEEFTGNSSVLA